MSDFHQRGSISTLHRLRPQSVDELDARLALPAQANPVGLVLPCTLTDFQGEAMWKILREVKQIPWLDRIVVSLNKADEGEMEKAREALLNHADGRIKFIWNDHPEIRSLFPQLAGGKGFNLWTAMGLLLEENHCRVMITHDTDILNYTRGLPALLALPLLEFDYTFVKGYYPRVSGQLFGRVTRLFIGPLLRALVRIEGHHPLLDFLDGFRYPLSGEFSARLAVLEKFSLAAGWDLEMDLLCSIHRQIAPESLAQIDLGSNYEHKHQTLRSGQSNEGLLRLASEIYVCLLRNLAAEGVKIDENFTLALQSTYLKAAGETVRRYQHVAKLNNLDFSLENENRLINEFSAVLNHGTKASNESLPAWADLKTIRAKIVALAE